MSEVTTCVAQLHFSRHVHIQHTVNEHKGILPRDLGSFPHFDTVKEDYLHHFQKLTLLAKIDMYMYRSQTSNKYLSPFMNDAASPLEQSINKYALRGEKCFQESQSGGKSNMVHTDVPGGKSAAQV